MLKIIRIMPIYRFRDGLGNVKKNDEILANCSALLSKGEMLTMFPEGNHGDKWQLRPLQRGVSRIAISSEAANNWLLNIAIVPVGIQYENAGTFRSRVLVSFGDPIHVGDYKETYLENSREALEKTKDDLADSMSELIVNIPEENYESDYSQLQNCRPYLRNYRKQVEADREIVASLQKGTELPKSSRGKYIIYNPLAYVLAPWAWINNILPNLLLKSFIKKKVKDPVFKDSLNWVFGTFLLPFYYLVIALIIGFSTANWWLALIYFISHPITVFLGGFDVLKKIKKAF